MKSTRFRIGTRVILVFALLLNANAPASSQTGDGRGAAGGNSAHRIHAGLYANHRFGYSVRIPEGLRGVGEPDGHPQPGIVIGLAAHRESDVDIRVFGEYDALFRSSAQGAAKAKLEYARKDAGGVDLTRWEKTRLGGLPALRFAYKFRDAKSGRAMITEAVVAFKPESKNDAATIFTVMLTTTRRRYDEDRVLFDKILKSWRAAPVL